MSAYPASYQSRAVWMYTALQMRSKDVATELGCTAPAVIRWVKSKHGAGAIRTANDYRGEYDDGHCQVCGILFAESEAEARRWRNGTRDGRVCDDCAERYPERRVA